MKHPKLPRALRKGDRVVMLSSWDDKGAVRATPLVVASAGAKRAYFLRQDGSNAQFEKLVSYINADSTSIRFLFADDVQPSSWIEFGRDFIADQREHYARRLTSSTNEPYLRAMREALASLRDEPVLVD